MIELSLLERLALTRPRLGKLWVEMATVTPMLVDTVFGDGEQLVGFGTINSRPNYYVLLVDSSWDLSNWAPDPTDHFSDHIDEIMEAIEEEFGVASYCVHCDIVNEDPDACVGHEYEMEPWPAFDLGGGCHWFPLERPVIRQENACA